MDEEQDERNGKTNHKPIATRKSVSDSEASLPDRRSAPEKGRRPWRGGSGDGARGNEPGKGKLPQYKKGYHQKNIQKHDRRVIPSNGNTDHVSESTVQRISDHGSFGRKQRFQRRRERRDRSKWKPYHLLSYEEKKERDERETRRAETRRNQRTALGCPPAPYNTTQFLMQDHKSEHDKVFDEALAMSSDDSTSPVEDNIVLDRGYDQEWARVFTANLSLLSKDKLVSYVLQTEQEKSDLERRIRSLENEVEKLTHKLDGIGNWSDDATGKEESLRMVVEGCCPPTTPLIRADSV